jgi:hypothetical protein
MGKMITLLLVILLALASVPGYLFLAGKITAGEKLIADGQRQLEKGRLALAQGKVKLEAGKLELSEGKKEYEQAEDNFFLVLADKLLQGGKGFEKAREQIAEGDDQVAKGEGEVKVGEKQVVAGEQELRLGLQQMRLAKGALLACALGAVFFTSLAIVLGFRWRRSLARIFKH